MPEIVFDAEKHIYTVDGIVRPSVTTVIKAEGLMGWTPGDEYYLIRGQYAHDALELYLNGDLDFESLSEGIKGFVESGIKFIDHTAYKATHTELMLFDPIYQYTGKVDSIPLLDFKTGGKVDWQILQLAAYYNLCKVNNLKGYESPMSVHLKEDGSMPTIHPYALVQIREALKVFLSALHLYQWKKNHGLLVK